MAELSIEKTQDEEWWPAGLRLLELEYENSKLLVHQDGLMFDKWKTDIDLLINDEKLHRESLSCEKLSQTIREHERLLQDRITSLEKELKESKELLCETKKSLEDVKEKSKAEEDRLQEKLTLEAEERLVKEQEKFKKERDALEKEVKKWKDMKEQLEVEMKEGEKMMRLEADKKLEQQEKEANGEIENLNKQLQTWKDKYAKTVQEVEDLKKELANRNVVSKTKATQTQNKMANKAVMAGVEYATIGTQAEIPTEHVNKEEKTLPKKQNRATRKRAHHNNKDTESAEQTSNGERGQQPDEQLEKNTQENQQEPISGPSKAKQTRTRNSRKNVQNELKKTSDKKDESEKDEECNELPGDIPTGPQGNVPSVAQHDMSSGTRDEVPTEIIDDEVTDANKDIPTGAKSNIRAETQGNRPTGVAGNEKIGHQAPDIESSDKTVKRVRKRKCDKEPCKIDEKNTKKNKSSRKPKSSSEDKTAEEHSHDTLAKQQGRVLRVVLHDNSQHKSPSVNDKSDTSSNTDKQRKTAEQTHTENILKDKNGFGQGTRQVTANEISKPTYPSTQPSMSDRTRQSSIAEISSMLNGTKRQRTLYNTKDTSLMVSFLPVQESFMNSTISRGNKPNGTMPPSLSAFMRSFIAPKLKKKST